MRTAEMKIVDTSPPNTSTFSPRHTGSPGVSELERRGSSTVLSTATTLRLPGAFLASMARSPTDVTTVPVVPLMLDHSILSRAFDTSEERYAPHELFQTAQSRSQGSGVATSVPWYTAPLSPLHVPPAVEAAGLAVVP